MHRQTSEPFVRQGPRPLLLHLNLAMMRSALSYNASLNWSAAWQSSSAAAMRTRAAGEEEKFADAVAAELREQDAALIRGIAAYRRHPWRRMLRDPPVIWTEGASRLLDYSGRGAGLPVLFVPSLVNRAYVLDLREGGSMMRWLAEQGVRPLLLDWGWPGEVERGFTLTDYVVGRLERALVTAAAAAGRPVALAGYCMGGTLAVASALRQPDLIRALILLAPPWDFHADAPHRAAQAAGLLPLIEPVLQATGALPVDMLQSMFALLDPWSVAEKYRAFADMDSQSDQARLFVALEDWLNDGVPLAAQVARACLAEWYRDNAPARGQWRIAGLPVDPAAIRVPAFVAVPARDQIVPPASALSLATRINGAAIHRPPAGHIGMAAGPRAEEVLWRPLLNWLRDVVDSG